MPALRLTCTHAIDALNTSTHLTPFTPRTHAHTHGTSHNTSTHTHALVMGQWQLPEEPLSCNATVPQTRPTMMHGARGIDPHPVVLPDGQHDRATLDLECVRSK